MTSVPVPMCYSCAHLSIEPGMICDAFPEGIPEAIYLSRFDHRMPYAGDHGIVFMQDPDRPEPDWEIFAETPPRWTPWLRDSRGRSRRSMTRGA